MEIERRSVKETKIKERGERRRLKGCKDIMK
jgi:hypothetical protein